MNNSGLFKEGKSSRQLKAKLLGLEWKTFMRNFHSREGGWKVFFMQMRKESSN